MSERNPGRTVSRLVVGLAFLALLGFGVMVATDPGDNVSFAGHGVRTDPDGNLFLTGTFHNRCDLLDARVEVGFVAEDGSLVGSGSARVGGLAAEATWRFEVPIPSREAVRFRISKLRWNDGERDYAIGPYREREIAAR